MGAAVKRGNVVKMLSPEEGYGLTKNWMSALERGGLWG